MKQSIQLGPGFGGIGFSDSATMGGALTARLGAKTGYDTSDTDEVQVVVNIGPAWVLKLADDHYRFDEDGGGQDIEVVATAASAAMPAPSLNSSSSSILKYLLVSQAGTARVPGDFAGLSDSRSIPVLDVQRRPQRRQRTGLPVERDLHPGGRHRGGAGRDAGVSLAERPLRQLARRFTSRARARTAR